MTDLETAREYGERIHYEEEGTGNSGHFYIDRNGHVEQWVEPGRVAHHTRGYNDRSIGIELVNTGRWPDWYQSDKQDMTEPYPADQIDALLVLLNALRVQLHRLHWIAGHEDLDKDMISASDSPSWMVHRKVDPGPLFPWKQVLDSSGLVGFPGADHT